MIRKLFSFIIVFLLMLGAFTSAEFVAYGYLDPLSYTWLRGFIARFGTLCVFVVLIPSGARMIGVLGGDPIVFHHGEQQRILGTFYSILFVVIMGLLMLVRAPARTAAELLEWGLDALLLPRTSSSRC